MNFVSVIGDCSEQPEAKRAEKTIRSNMARRIEHQNEFCLERGVLEFTVNIGKSPPYDALRGQGKINSNDSPPISFENRETIFQQRFEPIWCLHNHTDGFKQRYFPEKIPSFVSFPRKKSGVIETAQTEIRNDKRREDGGRSRHGNYSDAVLQREPDQSCARVGKNRRTSIGEKRCVSSVTDPFDCHLGVSGFIVLIQSFERFLDSIITEQTITHSEFFADHKIDRL